MTNTQGGDGSSDERRSRLFKQEEMIAAEREFLWPNGAPTYRAGLALSGGGIRAATVALGVLQELAACDLLARFHYISSVSGGGYIASALSWFWCQKRVDEETALLDERKSKGKGSKQPEPKKAELQPVRFGADSKNFPFQDRRENLCPTQVAAAKNLDFLRNHGSYLTSGDGIGFAGLIVAVMRTILLSLAVWPPLLLVLFWIAAISDTALQPSQCSGVLDGLECRPVFKFLLIASCGMFVVFFLGVTLFSFLGRLRIDTAVPASSRRRRVGWILLCCAIGFALGVFIVGVFDQLDTLHPFTGVAIAVLAMVSVAFFMYAAAEFYSPNNRGYFLRRGFEKLSSYVLPLVVVALFVGSFPLIIVALKPATTEAPVASGLFGSLSAILALVSGVGTALYGYYLKAKSLLPGAAGKILATVGSIFFMSSLLLFAFVVASYLVIEQTSAVVTVAVLLLIFLAFGLVFFGSVNATGLHRFYRDRLMETFMPMTYSVSGGTAHKSDVADNLSVADVITGAVDRPYHLVNTHAILVNDSDPKVALRGGDNFLISPAFVGSSATGWMRTKDYIEGCGPITLASAMAVSGAAANANAGYIGTGVTRDRFLSAVMALLNIRLGLWIGNPMNIAGPAEKLTSKIARWTKPKVATYFSPVLTCGIFGYGNHREAQFLELSDGGHFENLGLYELVRRQLQLILVVDAEQDSDINLTGLVSSINRIKEDFGASVRFLPNKGPEVLLGKVSELYPSGVRHATSPFLVAEIEYRDGTRGVLIYIKATMVAGLEFTTAGYRATNPEFPHQSTTDQFFDPDQFEAYRDLGRKSCESMIRELALSTNFADVRKLLQQYGFAGPAPKVAPVSAKP